MIQTFVTTSIISRTIPTVLIKSLESLKNIFLSREVIDDYTLRNRLLSLDLDSKLVRYQTLVEDSTHNSTSLSLKSAVDEVHDIIIKVTELLQTLEYRLKTGSSTFVYVTRLWFLEESNENMVKTLTTLTNTLDTRVEYLFKIIAIEHQRTII